MLSWAGLNYSPDRVTEYSYCPSTADLMSCSPRPIGTTVGAGDPSQNAPISSYANYDFFGHVIAEGMGSDPTAQYGSSSGQGRLRTERTYDALSVRMAEVKEYRYPGDTAPRVTQYYYDRLVNLPTRTSRLDAGVQLSTSLQYDTHGGVTYEQRCDGA